MWKIVCVPGFHLGPKTVGHFLQNILALLYFLAKNLPPRPVAKERKFLREKKDTKESL